MPVKRRAAKGRHYRITAEAVHAFRAGDHLALARALDLRPWQVNPIDAVGKCPSWAVHSDWRKADWEMAARLRARLLEASQ